VQAWPTFGWITTPHNGHDMAGMLVNIWQWACVIGGGCFTSHRRQYGFGTLFGTVENAKSCKWFVLW
jgi:hypothetical protein